MTIRQGWKENRYQRLRGYLWRRFERVRELDHDPPGGKVGATYDRYVQLATALGKRQKEEPC